MSAEPPRRARTAVGAAGKAVSLVDQPPEVVWAGRLFFVALLTCVAVGLAGLVALILDAFLDGLPRLNWDLVSNFPSGRPEGAGFQSAIMGTIWVMSGVIATVVPIGVGAAIYLEEYADGERWYNRLIEVNIQNLAAVPSIVYGILGLGFIVRGPLDLGFVVFAGSLTLALLVLPTVILAAREAIRAVPDSIRQAARALGATKWQTIRRQVLPASIPGIATGTILALSRAIGETAPLLLVGATVFVTFNPEGFFTDTGYSTIPVQIFNWVTRPQDEFRTLAAAGIIVLIGLLLVMNSFAIWLRNRYQQRW